MSFFTYRGIPLANAKGADDETFVYTGQGETKVSGGYYMRYSDLKARLDWKTAPDL